MLHYQAELAEILLFSTILKLPSRKPICLNYFSPGSFLPALVSCL